MQPPKTIHSPPAAPLVDHRRAHCGWRKNYNMGVGVSERLLKLVPDHPMTLQPRHSLCHQNRARVQSDRIAEKKRKARIEVDPTFPRSTHPRLRLAQVGRTSEARELAQLVRTTNRN